MLGAAPVATFGLDVVPGRSPDNLERLIAALRAMDARYRQRPEPAPDRVALAGEDHHLLTTCWGPLDVLGTAGAGRDCDALLPWSPELEVAGVRVMVLGLEGLIVTKEETAGENDWLVLPSLRAILERSQEP